MLDMSYVMLGHFRTVCTGRACLGENLILKEKSARLHAWLSHKALDIEEEK